MPRPSKNSLIRAEARKHSQRVSRGLKKPSSYYDTSTTKVYYNADNPQLTYGNNSFSVSIRQPSGSRMGTMVGW